MEHPKLAPCPKPFINYPDPLPLNPAPYVLKPKTQTLSHWLLNTSPRPLWPKNLSPELLLINNHSFIYLMGFNKLKTERKLGTQREREREREKTHRESDRARKGSRESILGGLWDLVTTYNWAYNPTYDPPKWAYGGYPTYK